MSWRGNHPRGAGALSQALVAMAISLAMVALAGVGSPALAGPGAPAGDGSFVRAALAPGRINHVIVIELENESSQAAFGPKSPAKYLNTTLRHQGELLEHYFAIGHVSLDNYIAEVSGQAPNNVTKVDCFGASKAKGAVVGYSNVEPGTPDPHRTLNPGQVDGQGCVYPASVPTIASQLDAKYPPSPKTHVASWREYAQDMGNDPARDGGVADPSGGTDCGHPKVNGVDNAWLASPTDQYVTRHNPFVYFHSIIDDSALCDANVVPLGRLGPNGAPSPSGHLARDLAHASTTPRYAFITPNLCSDGHDATCSGTNADGTHVGGLVGADDFLQHWMPMILHSPAYTEGDTLVMITFDEAEGPEPAVGAACCNERSGPNTVSPGGSEAGTDPGGGQVGALLLNPRYVKAGSTDTTGSYNHYSALRSFEDLLGLTTGGTDGHGHLGFAAQVGLKPFGPDVFDGPDAG